MQMLPEDEEAVLLPSAQEIATLSVEQLVYTLRAAAGSAAGADVAAACCLQLYKLVQRSGNDDVAAHAGAFWVFCGTSVRKVKQPSRTPPGLRTTPNRWRDGGAELCHHRSRLSPAT